MATVKADTPPQQAYKGEITLAFDYQGNQRMEINTENISYVMIERMYENVNVLPIIYVSVNLQGDLYDKVISGSDNSKFYLKIRKKDSLSKTSVYTTVVEDTFTYVTSSTNADFGLDLNTEATKNNAYKGIMVGLVSAEMTNKLRKSFNGIYSNTNQEDLLKQVAFEELGDVVMSPLNYNNEYSSLMVPPQTSIYKLVNYIFEYDPFYNSNYTFFMDFDSTYLISKNGVAVDRGDGKPTNVILNVEEYTSKDGYRDGARTENGAYVVNVNASDSNIVINNATSMATNKIVSYWDSIEENKEYETPNENVYNTEKVSYVRTNRAANLKNEYDTNVAMLEITKQNADSDIFTPNKSFTVNNYGANSKYNGVYFLSYKREFYYINEDKEFIITSNIGLKKATNEEIVGSSRDTTPKTPYNKRRRVTTTAGGKSSPAGPSARMA